jgi:hypothetical protein
MSEGIWKGGKRKIVLVWWVFTKPVWFVVVVWVFVIVVW